MPSVMLILSFIPGLPSATSAYH